jgi:hypothetical protein
MMNNHLAEIRSKFTTWPSFLYWGVPELRACLNPPDFVSGDEEDSGESDFEFNKVDTAHQILKDTLWLLSGNGIMGC